MPMPKSKLPKGAWDSHMHVIDKVINFHSPHLSKIIETLTPA